METCFQGDLQHLVHPTGIHSIDSLSSPTITEVAAIYNIYIYMYICRCVSYLFSYFMISKNRCVQHVLF